MAIMVRDTKAGRSISAYIVMRGAEYVATVQFYFGDSGVVRCNAWSRSGNLFEGWASGHGYDKRTAAMSGCMIGEYKVIFTGEEWDRQLRDAGYTVHQAI